MSAEGTMNLKGPKTIQEAVTWIRADCDHKRQSCEDIGCHTGLALNFLVSALERAEQEADRLREALLKLTVDQALEGRAFKGNAELPGCEQFYQGYNAGIKVQFEYSSEVARAALSQEPSK